MYVILHLNHQKKIYHDLVNRYEASVSQMTTDMLFVVITIRSFPHSWFITGFVIRVTWRVSHVEHDPGWTQVPRKGNQFLFHLWYPLCYSCYKTTGKSWMKSGLSCDYDKRSISVVICNSYSVTVNHVMVATSTLT